MTALNVAGSTFVARVSSVVVFIVVGILAVFAVVTSRTPNPALLAPSTFPGSATRVGGGADVLRVPRLWRCHVHRERPRRPGAPAATSDGDRDRVAAAIYIAVSIGVFGTLTVPEVVAAGPTAIAVAAQPVLGQAGYWLMTVTALFATAGATNAGLYPALASPTTSRRPASSRPDGAQDRRGRPGRPRHRGGGDHPAGRPVRPVGRRVDRSAVALGIFALVTIGHLRIRADTGRTSPCSCWRSSRPASRC